MKNLAILMIMILFATISCFSRIITVDNKFPYIGDYTTIQEANDGAANGDIIYVYPSGIPYNGARITKKITIVGNGSWTNKLNDLTTIKDTVFFDNGANGSELIGMVGYFPVKIDANDIVIKRNLLSSIELLSNHVNTVITQNVIIRNDSYLLVWVHKSNTFQLSNNHLENYFRNNWNGVFTEFDASITGEIFNNFISAAEVVTVGINCNIYNNIIRGTVCGGSYDFNLIQGQRDVCPLIYWGPNNIGFNNIEEIFVDYSKGNLRLKEGSPAIASGRNGEDIGIYGGDNPFVEGCFPDIPIIYQFEAANSATRQNGVKVKIKAKSNK